MSYPKTDRKSIEEGERKLSVVTFEVENGLFAFFFEGSKERVGTLALALPRTPTSPGASSILLGDRNATTSRILAEFLASKFGKMSFASVFLPEESGFQLGKVLLKLAQSL